MMPSRFVTAGRMTSSSQQPTGGGTATELSTYGYAGGRLAAYDFTGPGGSVTERYVHDAVGSLAGRAVPHLPRMTSSLHTVKSENAKRLVVSGLVVCATVAVAVLAPEVFVVGGLGAMFTTVSGHTTSEQQGAISNSTLLFYGGMGGVSPLSIRAQAWEIAQWEQSTLRALRGGLPAEQPFIYGVRGGPPASNVLNAAGGGAKALETTAHGAERIAGAAATRGGVLSEAGVAAVREGGRLLTQADGATVRVLQNAAGRFNVVVEGQRGIITTFENISQKSLDSLARNYGWK
jgi:hypothetical protein